MYSAIVSGKPTEEVGRIGLWTVAELDGVDRDARGPAIDSLQLSGTQSRAVGIGQEEDHVGFEVDRQHQRLFVVGAARGDHRADELRREVLVLLGGEEQSVGLAGGAEPYDTVVL
jgi:hypothetical protein